MCTTHMILHLYCIISHPHTPHPHTPSLTLIHSHYTPSYPHTLTPSQDDSEGYPQLDIDDVLKIDESLREDKLRVRTCHCLHSSPCLLLWHYNNCQPIFLQMHTVITPTYYSSLLFEFCMWYCATTTLIASCVLSSWVPSCLKITFRSSQLCNVVNISHFTEKPYSGTSL